MAISLIFKIYAKWIYLQGIYTYIFYFKHVNAPFLDLPMSNELLRAEMVIDTRYLLFSRVHAL